MPRIRLALLTLSVLLIGAAPAAAHDDHRDTRDSLAPLDLQRTVATVARSAADEDGGLPVTWCGTERTDDDSVNNAFPVSRPQFKVVYAYAADRPNRFAQWKDALQRNVSLIGRFMGAQSGGRKAPRFDMGTTCGPQYLDIQVVQLPAGRAAYVDDFDALTEAVGQRLGSPGGPRDTFILADQLSSQPPGYWWGLGWRWYDDQFGAANAANNGGIWSSIWVPDAEPAPGASPEGFWPEGQLHEMSHNLGAVQDSAPHASGYGHCWDGYDVMCYHDGPTPRHEMTYECPQIAGVMSQGYDCGSDDYFNVAPAGGSYLASHWNIYNSVFLGDCASIAPACGGTGTTPAPTPPVSTAAPQLLGTPTLGARITLTQGSWTNSPTTFEYQWQRGDGAIWNDIPGATGYVYVTSRADIGQRLRALVIAGNDDGSTLAVTDPTDVVTEPAAPGPAGPTGAPAPVPTGTPPVGAPQPAPRVPGPTSAHAKLKIAVGKGHGRSLGQVAFALAGSRLTAATPKLKLPRGRYDVALCMTTLEGTTQRCAHRRFSAGRSGRVRPPKLAMTVDAASGARAALMVTAVGKLFAARTAGRAVSGVKLG